MLLNRLKTACLFFSLLMLGQAARADEGMWVLHWLSRLENDMQAKGMRLSAEDIYSINQSSIKDAVLQFGGGCTGSVISDKGLVVTNHHCGFGAIQRLSTVEDDLLNDGFWAKNASEERPAEGLTVTFLVRVEDVTTQALQGVTDNMDELTRNATIAGNINNIAKEAVQGTGHKAIIKPFYYGSEFYMFITETFKDIRLVGTPPSSVGKFGGDTDNWMWPRHTGDFSMFRIYADANNQPADYSTNNKPYKAKQYLPVSVKGIKPGDFTFVLGFPGSTEEYLPAEGIKMVKEASNPYKVALRGELIAAINKTMSMSPALRLQYAGKQAGMANAWKKWMGEISGLERANAISKREQTEKDFEEWANTDGDLKYSGLTTEMNNLYEELSSNILALEYYREAAKASEIMKMADRYNELFVLLQKEDATAATQVENLKKGVEGYFKNTHLPTDQKLFAISMRHYYEDIPADQHPAALTAAHKKYDGNFDEWAEEVYKKSIFGDHSRLNKFLESNAKSQLKTLQKDPALQLLNEFTALFVKDLVPIYRKVYARLDPLQRKFVQGLREMYPDSLFYPDANLTMRLTYGQIQGYEAYDGVYYKHNTTLEGIMEKEEPSGEFEVPDKLKQLYRAKNYGDYAQDGQLPVAFVATNHTTGGNFWQPRHECRWPPDWSQLRQGLGRCDERYFLRPHHLPQHFCGYKICIVYSRQVWRGQLSYR